MSIYLSIYLSTFESNQSNLMFLTWHHITDTTCCAAIGSCWSPSPCRVPTARRGAPRCFQRGKPVDAAAASVGRRYAGLAPLQQGMCVASSRRVITRRQGQGHKHVLHVPLSAAPRAAGARQLSRHISSAADKAAVSCHLMCQMQFTS